LEKVADSVQLDNFFQIYLGKKGLLNEEFKVMVDLAPEEKKEKGAKLSEIKTKLTQAYEAKEQSFKMGQINEQLEKDLVDIGLDVTTEHGSYSLLAEVRRDVEEIFKSMGFVMEYGTEMVTKFENFESVNIPLTHPATEMHDTIYLNEKDTNGENFVLRTHTSSMQNFMIKKYGVPLKALVPGRAYRFENMDATHDVMFYQVEGMYIAKNVSIAHFKNIVDKMLEAVLKKKVETRMRP
jgi:phenylalanyl-tRNA synthetase alpha chain